MGFIQEADVQNINQPTGNRAKSKAKVLGYANCALPTDSVDEATGEVVYRKFDSMRVVFDGEESAEMHRWLMEDPSRLSQLMADAVWTYNSADPAAKGKFRMPGKK